jgi:hypothetical protein
MQRSIFASLVFALSFSANVNAQEASTPKSYSTSWIDASGAHRSVMFPHDIDGCKALIQSRERSENGLKIFSESEGRDCNCDLVIDGQEKFYSPAKGYGARRLLEVCQGPAVDGKDRKFLIMRESLKAHPRYSRISNVQQD